MHDHSYIKGNHSIIGLKFMISAVATANYFSEIIYTYRLLYRVIATRKYHEFIAVYCYECTARVTMLEAMNE